jgi:cbb3-type cytochrome oxidase maturation protein
MNVLILLLFVSITLALAAVGFFVWNFKERAHDHNDRLAILPLEDD